MKTKRIAVIFFLFCFYCAANYDLLHGYTVIGE